MPITIVLWYILVTSCTITVCSHLRSSVKVTSDGMDSLVALSQGDMRRALNILQSTSMAHDEVSEKTVYLCTGQPLPSDIAQIVEWMLNLDFSTAYNSECVVVYNIICTTLCRGSTPL